MTQSRNKQKKASVSVEVMPDELRRIYDHLENEAVPFEARVKNVGKGVRQFTIVADADNIGHFKSILA